MTDYSYQFGQIIKQPETVVEAVDQLLLILADEQKTEIASLDEDDLVDLHFTLGLANRNAFGLHDLGNKLLADCGTPHPDDGAGIIVNSLWKKLTQV